MSFWHNAILRIVSLGVPGGMRSEWLRTWKSELSYVPRCDTTAFCLGALSDLALLWRDNPAAIFDSPLSCLIALAACSATVFLVGFTAARRTLSLPSGSDTANNWPIAVLLFLLLMGIGAIVGRGAAFRSPGPRDLVFLAVKLALAVPFFYGALLLVVALHGPVVLPMVIFVLLARRIFADQLRRCPHCLGYLHSPVAIGCASETFLHWYGTESVCTRCRALMQIPDISARYCADSRWLQLDNSWNGVFAGNAEPR